MRSLTIILLPLVLEPVISTAVIQGQFEQFERAETAVGQAGSIDHTGVPVPEGKARSVRLRLTRAS
jgi:hypothetical protein